MKIRRAKPSEAIILSALAFRSKGYWGYDAAFMESCREALTLSEQYISENNVFVIGDDTSIFGFCAWIANVKGTELDYLFIDPEFIEKGYGRQLWNHGIDVARENGSHEFKIVSDPHAEAFYKKMGAVRIGEIDAITIKGRKLPKLKMMISNH